MTNIVAPSDFKMVTLNDEFELITNPNPAIDIGDTNENSALLKEILDLPQVQLLQVKLIVAKLLVLNRTSI